MLQDLYPLTGRINEIVHSITKTTDKDVTLFVHWVANELKVNTKIISYEILEGFKPTTIEFVFEKDYIMVEGLRFKKHWTCVGSPEPYFIALNELMARVRRLEIKPI